MNQERISLYALAKLAGVRPQSLYNMARMGYIDAERNTCEHCGSSSIGVTREVAEAYLAKRAEKEAAKK